MINKTNRHFGQVNHGEEVRISVATFDTLPFPDHVLILWGKRKNLWSNKPWPEHTNITMLSQRHKCTLTWFKVQLNFMTAGIQFLLILLKWVTTANTLVSENRAYLMHDRPRQKSWKLQWPLKKVYCSIKVIIKKDTPCTAIARRFFPTKFHSKGSMVLLTVKGKKTPLNHETFETATDTR